MIKAKGKLNLKIKRYLLDFAEEDREIELRKAKSRYELTRLLKTTRNHKR